MIGIYRKSNKKRLGILLLFFVTTLSFICFVIGFRFTSDSAVHTLRFIQTNEPRVILSEPMTPKMNFYLIDAGSQYYTAYCRQIGLLWKATIGPEGQKKTEDKLELLNKFWLDDSNGIGWVVILSHDSDVHSVLITYGDQYGEQSIDQVVHIDQPTVIKLSNCSNINMNVTFKAEALSQDNIVLYELDYFTENNVTFMDEYRWIPSSASIKE